MIHDDYHNYGYHSPTVIHVNGYDGYTPTYHAYRDYNDDYRPVRVIQTYGNDSHRRVYLHHRTSPAIIGLACAIGCLACLVIACVCAKSGGGNGGDCDNGNNGGGDTVIVDNGGGDTVIVDNGGG